MLYQRKSKASLARRAVALLTGLIGVVARNRADAAYLDGMRPSELEDLGLRRSEDGRYRFF